MKKSELLLTIVVGLFSVLGVGFSITFLFTGGANEGFEQYPNVTLAHVVPGLIYLALAPLQFLQTIRSKQPAYHRWSGRILATIGLILGGAALFIGIIIPYSGLLEQIVIGGFGLFFLVSIVKGFLNARRRNFEEHREWMLRAYAIGLSIVTMRLIFIPILIVIGNPTREEAELYSIVSFTASFFLHWGFAEYWIRHTRSSGNASSTSDAVSS